MYVLSYPCFTFGIRWDTPYSLSLSFTSFVISFFSVKRIQNVLLPKKSNSPISNSHILFVMVVSLVVPVYILLYFVVLGKVHDYFLGLIPRSSLPSVVTSPSSSLLITQRRNNFLDLK